MVVRLLINNITYEDIATIIGAIEDNFEADVEVIDIYDDDDEEVE